MNLNSFILDYYVRRRVLCQATKLIRVLSDKKRLEMTSAGGSGVPGSRHRDVETEELIEDQQHKIRELERQVWIDL